MTTRAFRKSSIKDVARLAGVSTTTVSYFVSGRENVCSTDTAARIRAAIAELHYTPSSLTRGLRHGATNTIGVCLYSPLDPAVRFGGLFFERLWRGIVREADAADFSLLHYPISVHASSSIDAFLDGRVDGVVFHGMDDTRPQKAAQAGMPVLLVTRSLHLPDGCGSVYADERQTIGLALGHLRALGHRRIAHLAGPVGPRPGVQEQEKEAADIAVQRLRAFTEQQTEAGEFDPALIGYNDSWRDDNGRVADIVAAWHALPAPPTAVVCANDSLALAVVAAATARGWSVPHSLSVVGIDDSDEARSASLPITSVAVPVEAIGREAVRGLLRLMGGAAVDACRVSLPVTEIVVRASTAPI